MYVRLFKTCGNVLKLIQQTPPQYSMPVWIARRPALCFVSCVFSYIYIYIYIFFFVSCSRGQRLLFNEQQPHFSYFFIPLSHQWVPYTVYGTHKYHFSATFSLKMSFTILFTHLKIILLQCFQIQFSVSITISSIQTDPQCLFGKNYFCQLILLFSLFLLLFLGFITLFDTIHGSHCTITANFYLYL